MGKGIATVDGVKAVSAEILLQLNKKPLLLSPKGKLSKWRIYIKLLYIYKIAICMASRVRDAGSGTEFNA